MRFDSALLFFKLQNSFLFLNIVLQLRSCGVKRRVIWRKPDISEDIPPLHLHDRRACQRGNKQEQAAVWSWLTLWSRTWSRAVNRSVGQADLGILIHHEDGSDVSLKRRACCELLHSVTTEKAMPFIITTVWTSNPVSFFNLDRLVLQRDCR